MKIRHTVKILLLILMLSPIILLHGCIMPNLPEFTSPAAQPPDIEEEVPPQADILAPPEVVRPGRFILRYSSESSMNPIVAVNRDNINLTSLIFESLFVLNNELIAEPLLVYQWHTEDNITFTFEILPDIAMHDGSTLTADDVAYSIRQASQQGRHTEKLRSISNIDSDGELTVTIELNAANARFTRLLDIPIIKEGSIGSHLPPGTGPYIYLGPSAFRLIRFSQHRYADYFPLTSIHLRECYDNELTTLFDDGGLSLLWDDPTGVYNLRLNRLHEPRFYNTTAFQYIGFNVNTPALRNQDVRRAIGNSINRQLIVDEVMSVPRSGQTIAAPVAISPIFDMYDPMWEHIGQDPLIEMAYLLERAGLEDVDYDGFLEFIYGTGSWSAFTLDFIVNIENSHRVAAANVIADTLIRNGINTHVRAIPWALFIDELEDGNFDMFFGETMLGADFDLSPLLLPGPLNFGGTASTSFEPFIRNFLAASTPEEVSLAGHHLINEIRITAPFAPILYKRHAFYTPIGVVGGASPSQSSIFRNFQDWTVDLLMLN